MTWMKLTQHEARENLQDKSWEQRATKCNWTGNNIQEQGLKESCLCEDHYL